MDKATYKELKKSAALLNEELNQADLSEEERAKLESLRSQVTGALFNPWLPVGITRKIIMLILAFVGFYGSIYKQYYLLLLWLLIPTFSPRLVGECILLFSHIKTRIKQ